MNCYSAAVVPSPDAVARLTESVFAFLRRAGVEARAVNHVGLVIEELLTNVATHGGNARDQVQITISVEPDRVRCEIIDRGRAFDPRAAATPEFGASLQERPIGGLGLHLVKQLTSALDYRRDGERNWTGFCVRRET